MCIMPFRMLRRLIWPKRFWKRRKKYSRHHHSCMVQILHWLGRDKTYAPVVAFSINQSDAITAVSNNLRDETYKTFKIEKEIEVIYNFVDVQRFNRKPIDAFKKVIAPNGERILLHASNFRKIKRVQDVVKIFYEVNKEIPCKLLFVGDGPER